VKKKNHVHEAPSAADSRPPMRREHSRDKTRFLIDGVRSENAWNADKYVWSDHAQGENSVIVI